jgi:hypothetical protein
MSSSSSSSSRSGRAKQKANKAKAEEEARRKRRKKGEKIKEKAAKEQVEEDENHSSSHETESDTDEHNRKQKNAKRQTTVITLVAQITVTNIQTLVLRSVSIHNKDLYEPCNTFPHIMFPAQYADPARAIVKYGIVKLCVHDTEGDIEAFLNKSVVPNSCKLPQQMRNVINTCINRGQRFAVSALRNTCSLAVQCRTGGDTAKVLGDKHTHDPTTLDTIGNNAYAPDSTQVAAADYHRDSNGNLRSPEDANQLLADNHVLVTAEDAVCKALRGTTDFHTTVDVAVRAKLTFTMMYCALDPRHAMDIIHAWVNTPEPKLIDLLSNNTQGFLRWCLGMLLGNPAACKQEQWWSSKPNYKAEIVANIRYVFYPTFQPYFSQYVAYISDDAKTKRRPTLLKLRR